jgi:DNA-binding NtrC family response regulator
MIPGAAEVRSSNILLAEDDEVVRRYLETVLRRAGYEIISVSSGADAVSAGGQPDRPIDLLISDVVMPGLPGPEVANRLMAVHPRMKVLFLSGYPAQPTEYDRTPVERADFLQKPFSPGALLARVRERLGG